VLLALAGQTVTDNQELQAELLEHDPGDRVEVDIVRGADEITVEVALGTRPVPIAT
jgi:S1-C subfamily serine protease